jgi:hypothetical protein
MTPALNALARKPHGLTWPELARAGVASADLDAAIAAGHVILAHDPNPAAWKVYRLGGAATGAADAATGLETPEIAPAGRLSVGDGI